MTEDNELGPLRNEKPEPAWRDTHRHASGVINEMTAALVEAQAKMGKLERNKEVQVTTKTGGTYTFRYAPLDKLIEHVREPLTSNGLWFVQLLGCANGGECRLTTKLIHTSGQWQSSEVPLMVEKEGNQAFGSALTYMRRYQLEAILGLAASEDDDANAADGNKARETSKPAPKPRPKPATSKAALKDMSFEVLELAAKQAAFWEKDSYNLGTGKGHDEFIRRALVAFDKVPNKVCLDKLLTDNALMLDGVKVGGNKAGALSIEEAIAAARERLAQPPDGAEPPPPQNPLGGG